MGKKIGVKIGKKIGKNLKYGSGYIGWTMSFLCVICMMWTMMVATACATTENPADKVADLEFTVVPEEEIPVYTSATEMCVYSWHEEGKDHPGYSIWCFHGRPTWFAEGEAMRIYELIPLG